MTVTGPVAAADLGVTLPHEHVYLDLPAPYDAETVERVISEVKPHVESLASSAASAA